MDSHRRTLLAAFAAAGLALPLRGFPQAEKTAVIGLLGTDSTRPSVFAIGLLDAMRDKGWVVGRNLRVEDRVTAQGYDAYAEGVAELVRAKVDVIAANGATATSMAAKATKQIPIVMNVGVDPVEAGFVSSLARPGRNITGVANQSATLNAKRLELLKELSPGLSSVGVLLADNVATPTHMRDLDAAGRALNLQMHFRQARTPGEIDGAIAELAKLKVGAFFVAPSSAFNVQSTRIVEAVTKHRIPAVYPNERFVDAGALMVYSTPRTKNFISMAAYIDRILKGARPGEMAIEQSSNLDLVVNLKTAKALGIKVPQSILVRADQVIE
jgi:putative ABC transport system substrate-binding protein